MEVFPNWTSIPPPAPLVVCRTDADARLSAVYHRSALICQRRSRCWQIVRQFHRVKSYNVKSTDDPGAAYKQRFNILMEARMRGVGCELGPGPGHFAAARKHHPAPSDVCPPLS
ncbi:hypothetical protein J6590_047094 [Homalodisca vitripennis]|nr:hypothetical protein J6590_047094 [Homalodisca vitripennis]